MEPTLPPGLPIVPEPEPPAPVTAPMSAAPEVPTAPPISAMIAPPAPSAPTPVAAAPQPAGPARGFNHLLGDAFGIWKRQWLRLFAVSLLGILPILLAGALIAAGIFAASALGSAGLVVAIALGVIGVFLAIVGLVRLGLTYVHLVAGHAEDLGVRGAWARSRGSTWSFVWVSLLAQLVTFGGALLLIAPAIVWSLSFAIVPWVFATEGGRGFGALVTARSRVRGHWWRVFLNLVGVAVLAIVASMPLQLAGAALKGNVAAQATAGVLNGFLQLLLLSPLSAAFGYAVYADLRARNADPLPIPPRQKTLFAVAAVVGLLAQLAVLAFTASAPLKFLGALSNMRSGGGRGLSNDLEMPDPDAGLLLPGGGTQPETIVEEPVIVEEPAAAPEESDDDEDGYPKYIEDNEGTDPGNPDTDGDGLADGDELTFGSSPKSPDTDGDGFADGEEVRNGYHPGLVNQPYDEERLSVIRGAAGNFHEPTRTTLEGAPILAVPAP